MNVRFIISSIIVIGLCSCSTNSEKNLFRIQENGLYGFIDSLGHVMIEPQYKYAGSFNDEGYALVISKMTVVNNNVEVQYGYINKENELMIDTNNIFIIRDASSELKYTVNNFNKHKLGFNDYYFQLLRLRDGRYVFQDNKTYKFGFKDIKGDIVIEPQYDRANSFCNGLAVVQKKLHNNVSESVEDNNCWGAINPDGSTAVKFEYGLIQDFTKEGKTWTTTFYNVDGGRFGCECAQIDKTGKVLIGPVTSVQHIWNNSSSNIYCASIYHYNKLFNNWYTFIDENGNILTDFNKDGIISVDFRNGGKAEWYNGITYFSEGRAGIKGFYMDNPAWWFVDEKLKIVSEAYDSVFSYSEGLAAVKELSSYIGMSPAHWGKWGYINKKDEVVIPFKFSECESFINGLAYFKTEGNTFDIEGYINKSGKCVWQTKRKKDKLDIDNGDIE